MRKQPKPVRALLRDKRRFNVEVDKVGIAMQVGFDLIVVEDRSGVSDNEVVPSVVSGVWLGPFQH